MVDSHIHKSQPLFLSKGKLNLAQKSYLFFKVDVKVLADIALGNNFILTIFFKFFCKNKIILA